MSEPEKLQREQHQARRNKCLLIQKIVLIALVVAFSLSAFGYFHLNKNTYVYYTEEGNSIHKAYLNANDFYEEGYLNGTHVYVASLVEKMTADFSYKLKIDTDEVKFKYNWRIDAELEIKDPTINAPLYNHKTEIVAEQTVFEVGNDLLIEKTVEIDYPAYNAKANAFLAEYGIADKGFVSTLIVRMYVNVVGQSEVFASDRSGEYVTELRIPLAEKTFKPQVSVTVPQGEQKILAINTSYRAVVGALAILFGTLTVLSAVALVVYSVKTSDKHVDYARRVSRLLRSYKSYIQRVLSDFDTNGYQTLRVNEFGELLEIRDTLQKPILFSENEDRTCSRFYIVGDSMILYVYEITVAPSESEDAEPANA